MKNALRWIGWSLIGAVVIPVAVWCIARVIGYIADSVPAPEEEDGEP